MRLSSLHDGTEVNTLGLDLVEILVGLLTDLLHALDGRAHSGLNVREDALDNIMVPVVLRRLHFTKLIEQFLGLVNLILGTPVERLLEGVLSEPQSTLAVLGELLLKLLEVRPGLLDLSNRPENGEGLLLSILLLLELHLGMEIVLGRHLINS